MNRASFLLVGITDGSGQSLNSQTLTTLLANGLDYIYWRSPALADYLDLFPAHVQASVLVSAATPDGVSAPFRWHLKESVRPQFPAGSHPFSTSVHRLSDWPVLIGQAELVFYSPVFPSISKPGYGPAISLDLVAQQLATIRQQHDRLPLLIGLGGVNVSNVLALRQAGFDGAALMGALWQTPDPVDAVKQVRASLDLPAP